MGEGFSSVLQAYTEVGILGLLAVLVVILIWRSFGRKGKDDDWKKSKIDKKDEIMESDKLSLSNQLQDLTKTIIETTEKNFEREREMNRELLKQVIDSVNNHSLSKDENDKLTEINRCIDNILKDILNETNASRASLVQYHNGGRGINKQAFLKLSMTNEKTKTNVKTIMPEVKDQFRSILGYFVNELNEKGQCYILDIEDVKSKDIGMYELMSTRGIEAKCGHAIHNKDDMVIGYICVEFENKKDAVLDDIKVSFTEHYREIERLLNS